MNKLKMHSPNLTQENIARIRELFPDCVTEVKDEGGGMKAENVSSSFSLPHSSLFLHPSSFQQFEVFFVDENALIACFDTGVNEELVKELARFEPLRVVFRDTGFISDAVKINVEQIFKQMSPGTEVKAI